MKIGKATLLCWIIPIIFVQGVWGGERVPVTEVVDGDTVKGVYMGEMIRIRLAGIDAPEMGQRFGPEAKSMLCRLAWDRLLEIRVVDVDRYGRVVAYLSDENQVINYEMVRWGYAWWYFDFSDDMEIERLEMEARTNKWGLWKLIDPIPPWEHRRGER